MKSCLLWKKIFESNDENAGYVLLRLFIGAMFIMHGYGKVFGGLSGFAGYVEKMGVPMFAVLAPLAAYTEFVGGILLVLGILTRVSAFFIVCDMGVAVFVAHAGAPFKIKELALAYLFVCLMFFFKGAGKYSLDYLIHSINCKSGALENDASSAKQ